MLIPTNLPSHINCPRYTTRKPVNIFLAFQHNQTFVFTGCSTDSTDQCVGGWQWIFWDHQHRWGQCKFIRSFVYPFILSFVHSLIRSFVHSFIRSFVYSFIFIIIHSFLVKSKLALETCYRHLTTYWLMKWNSLCYSTKQHSWMVEEGRNTIDYTMVISKTSHRRQRWERHPLKML